MSRTMRKVLSIICAITLLVTSMTGLKLTSVSADTTTTIITTADTDARTAILNEIANADYNFALGKIASVSNLTPNDGGTDLGIVTNGTFATGNNKDTIIEIGRADKTNTPWVQVDLGAAFDTSKIDRVAVQYKTNNSGPKSGYYISYSLNGIDFVTVATIDAIAGTNNQIYLDKITLTAEQAEAIPYARYVRVTSTTDNSAYGLQVKGMAVLTDGTVKVSEVSVKEMETIDTPKSVTVTSSDYCQLEYIFEGAEGHDDYTYYAYINGTMGNEPVVADTEYVVKDLAEGTYEIKIVSYKDGNVSEGISGTVEVKDYKGLIYNERNIAAGKTTTSDSVREEDSENKEIKLKNLTDGVISGDANTLTYRTEQNNAIASVVIDLGEVYKAGALERIIMVFNTGRYAQDYTVECSLDGETYEQIGATTGENSELSTIELDATQIEATEARYVRINFTKAVAMAYGYQIYEIAIIENQIDIAEAKVSIPESVSYIGEAVEPEITLTYKDKQLVINKDYELLYSDNTAVGTAKVTINGLGRYTNSVERTFNIVKQDVANVAINTSFDEENELVVEVINGNVKLVKDVDYTCELVVLESADNFWYDVYLIVTGIGENYTGTVQKTIEFETIPVNEPINVSVTSHKLNQITVQFENANKLYADRQLYDIYIDDELVGDDKFAGTYTYDNQIVGTHTVKIVAILGEKESTGISNDITVDGKDISSENATIEVEEILPIYSGLPMQVGIVVKYGEDVLIQDVDYTLEFTDNINAGTAKYKVTGIGLYKGVVEGEFEIGKKALTFEDVKITTSYNANKELVVDVTDGRMILTEGVDYSYKAVTDADYNVTITVTALDGNYTGSKIITIDGNDNPNKPEPTTVAPTTTQKLTTTAKVNKPGQVKIKNIKKAGKNKVKVSWKKIKGAKGYQIRYSTSKKFKKATKKLINKNKTKYTIKKLKKKKYYIQVRAYVVKNGKKLYGKWSKRANVKITK